MFVALIVGGLVLGLFGFVVFRLRYMYVNWFLSPDARFDDGDDSFVRRWSPIWQGIGGGLFMIIGLGFVVVGLFRIVQGA